MTTVEEIESVIAPKVQELSDQELKQLVERIVTLHSQGKDCSESNMISETEFKDSMKRVFDHYDPLLQKLSE